MLTAPYVGKCSFMEMASKRKKKNLKSLEFDVLLSEIHKGKSVILTESAVELKDPLRQRNMKSVVLLMPGYLRVGLSLK